MGRVHQHRVWLPALATLVLFACPVAAPVDAGMVDAGVQSVPPSCDTPEDCRAQNFDGVCRATECLADVPCGDDVECGLGELCVAGLCRFRGCVADADCGSGRCRAESFSCAECGQSKDCPASRPVCDVLSNTCVSCSSDLECPQPGPGRCDRTRGSCTWCLEDKHCPNGLTCGAGGICVGAKSGISCPAGTACDLGLACVLLGGVATCLPTCSLYKPNDCTAPDVCFTFTSGMVFENGEPRGVCYDPGTGLRAVNDLCTRNAAGGSNCIPNLECVPESATASRCRRFCDPATSIGCAAPNSCHPFIGDYWSNRYGLCYPDNGYGLMCSGEAACGAQLACMPFEDPSKTYLLAGVCQFSIGTQPVLAPCAPQPLTDGGVLAADRVCKSGACVNDPGTVAADFFCFGACTADPDCSVAGRKGYCDTLYDFPISGGVGSLKGCRPKCDDEAACGEYDAGFTCKVRVNGGSQANTKLTCGVVTGILRAGEPCVVNAQCRSGLCVTSDSRGVSRAGVCSEACDDPGDCSAAVVDGGFADGGVAIAPLSCAVSTLLGYRGFDNVAGTTDDRFVTQALCLGTACSADEQCGDVDAGGFARCVPEYAPWDAGFAYELRCRPPTNSGGMLEAPGVCAIDAQCLSGVCGTLQAPSLGTGKTCLRSCDSNSVCPAGTTCRDSSLVVGLAFGGTQAFRSCTP